MELAAYDAEAAAQKWHWWYVARRSLIKNTIVNMKLPHAALVLDAGTCSGGNLNLLRDCGFSHPIGLDFSADALAYCRQNGHDWLIQGDTLNMPFSDGTLDLVLCTDVLEHIDDDDGAVAEIVRVLKPGGKVLLTVPAFRALWGHGDEVALHQRRYQMAEFRAMLQQAGLEVEHGFHFNFLLFLPILAARKLLVASKATPRSELTLNTPWLNRLLGLVFGVDVALAPLLRPPFGVSLLVVARRPDLQG
ncbi:class I SAM-dependent methyltransferase [Magnetospirillum fulvum]|uniref:Methyltransferase domain-containing protein n=1 Tax=Magnetospirillum fulvum TaxID=1082 RepID=A0A1H6H7B9_MAGFU|nr:methyltransferase domain-containing protein [Magnetospirillum fulvum]SEH30184.1 Methyltransferase domain-containing protein [Magnetospirillum fulvum]